MVEPMKWIAAAKGIMSSEWIVTAEKRAEQVEWVHCRVEAKVAWIVMGRVTSSASTCTSATASAPLEAILAQSVVHISLLLVTAIRMTKLIVQLFYIMTFCLSTL